MVSWITAFMAEAKTLTGVAPIINTYQDWWDACTGDSTDFTSDLLWFDTKTCTSSAPQGLPTGWDNWAIWQYSCTGTVPGISADTDLDYLDGAPQTYDSVAGSAVSVQTRTLNSLTGQTATYTAAGLPAGTSISAAGLITGTPATAGPYTVPSPPRRQPARPHCPPPAPSPGTSCPPPPPSP